MRRTLIFTAASLAITYSCAHAEFHFFDFTEAYSNADGSIQFIELSASINNQHLFSGHSITSSENTFNFTENLSSSTTANKSILLATDGFAALPGAVTPDFIIPQNFFSVDGDTLTLVGGVYSALTWSSGGLPTDGLNSLNRSIGGGTATSTAVNSPKNFAGDTGSIDLSGGGEEPTDAYVDFSAGENQDGSAELPFDTVAEAVDLVSNGGTVFIFAGETTELLVINVDKQFSIQAVNGIVTIGSPPPRPNGFRSRTSSR